jgi:hypothetical protein
MTSGVPKTGSEPTSLFSCKSGAFAGRMVKPQEATMDFYILIEISVWNSPKKWS